MGDQGLGALRGEGQPVAGDQERLRGAAALALDPEAQARPRWERARASQGEQLAVSQRLCLEQTALSVGESELGLPGTLTPHGGAEVGRGSWALPAGLSCCGGQGGQPYLCLRLGTRTSQPCCGPGSPCPGLGVSLCTGLVAGPVGVQGPL